MIQSDDEAAAVLDVHVHGRYGYIQYSGRDLFGYSVGDPASPDLEEVSEAGFPAGTGLPVERFRAALVEFVESHGALPRIVDWRPVEAFLS